MSTNENMNRLLRGPGRAPIEAPKARGAMNDVLRAAAGHRVEPEPESQPEPEKPSGFDGGVTGEHDLLSPPQDLNSQIRQQAAALKSRVDTDEVLPPRRTTGDIP